MYRYRVTIFTKAGKYKQHYIKSDSGLNREVFTLAHEYAEEDDGELMSIEKVPTPSVTVVACKDTNHV